MWLTLGDDDIKDVQSLKKGFGQTVGVFSGWVPAFGFQSLLPHENEVPLGSLALSSLSEESGMTLECRYRGGDPEGEV